MHGNGASACAHLEARVSELEAALSLLTRRLEEKILPRVLATEEEVAGQRETLTDLGAALRALADNHDDHDRRRR